jgi:carboxymethylenebutenolidase
VVVQEIFGVNAHIRKVTEHFASLGYVALSPAIFDRIERGVQLSYSGTDREKAMQLYQKLDARKATADVVATIRYGTQSGKAGVVGYCYGGLLAWLAASEDSGLSAAVGYYGGGITNNLDKAPKCPVQLHYGTLDGHVPIEPARAIPNRYPGVQVYEYPADHGFNCDERPSYNREAAALAGQRTEEFFAKYVG